MSLHCPYSIFIFYTKILSIHFKMDSEFPEFFDPFGDYTPDYDGFYFDFNDLQIHSPDGEVFPAALSSQRQCQNLVSQEVDPNPTLKSLLEQEFHDNKPPVSDPQDVMPERVFTRYDQFIHFNDTSFAGTYLRSEQNCKNRDLAGYVLLPARYLPRVRSRLSNHSKPTDCAWLPPDLVPDPIRAIFE